ncbi:MAG: sialidase family protein [Acidimicrobiales bacterium]
MHPSGKRRPVAALVTAAATTLTMLGVASSPAPAQTVGELRFGENYRQGSDAAASRGRDVPGLAVNPADPKHVVSVDVDYLNGECSYKTSFDGGVTWSHSGNFNAPAGWPDPPCFQNFDSGGYAHGNASVVFGAGQNVYSAFSSHRGPFQRPESGIVAGIGDDSLVVRSTDGGRTWHTAVPAILGDPNEGGQPFNIRPQVAVHPGQGAGGQDRVYVAAWRCRVISGGCSAGNDIREVWVARSDDNGQNWLAPVRATAPTGGPTGPGLPGTGQVNEPSQPVVDPRNGYVYIAWHRRDGSPTPSVSSAQVARSKDLGQTWERFDASPTTGSAHPRIAINPNNGTLYLTYQDNRFGSPTTTDTDIVFQRSLDTGSGAGEAWSAPLRVNDDRLNNGAAQQVPRVEVAPGGRVDVVWMDRRHDPTSPTSRGRADIFYAHSLDGGLTFSANRRVTDRHLNRDVGLTGVGGYTWYGPVLAPMGNEEVLIAWTDSREGNFNTGTQDVYLSKLNLRSTAVPVKRLPQTSRTSLSVTLSKIAYPGGLEGVGATPQPVTKPVIVSETDPVLALAAAPLARAYWGPLLASPAARLTNAQTAEVARLEPVGAYLVGDDTALGAGVAAAINEAGVPTAEVRRISAATPAETARDIALVMDQRTAAQKQANAAAFPTAVIVNPAGKEAAAAASLATSLGVPILFVDLNGVPGATSAALSSLNITSTIVVAGPSAVTDGVVASLPGATRVPGSDAPTLSVAAAVEARSRRLPTNIVYVVDAEQQVEAAMVAAAVGRTGGVSILTAGADPGVAEAGLANVGMRGTTDRLVVVRSVEGAGAGYRLVARDGGVFAFAGANFHGSTGGIRLAQPMVGMATTPTNAGYWLVAGDGGVFAFGDAIFRGSTGAIRLAQPVVGMAPTPSGKGYWLVAADGGVFAFGDARFLGSTGSLRLNQPVVGMAATPSGEGYWLVAADGGVFAFGDARFRGSTGALRLNQPVMGIAPTASGFGYWMVARDGGVFAFGDAQFYGSTGGARLAQPVVGIEATDSGRGYWFTAADGGVFAFGDAPFYGSTGAIRLAQPMVGMSAGRS